MDSIWTPAALDPATGEPLTAPVCPECGGFIVAAGMTPKVRRLNLDMWGESMVTCEGCGKRHILGRVEWGPFPAGPLDVQDIPPASAFPGRGAETRKGTARRPSQAGPEGP